MPTAHLEAYYINSMMRRTLQNRDLAMVLFKKLFLEFSDKIPQLENALTLSELTQAHTIIHKLHGSVSFCGFAEFQELAKNLEESLLRDDLQQAKQAFLLLKQKIVVFQSLQEKILQQLTQIV